MTSSNCFRCDIYLKPAILCKIENKQKLFNASYSHLSPQQSYIGALVLGPRVPRLGAVHRLCVPDQHLVGGDHLQLRQLDVHQLQELVLLVTSLRRHHDRRPLRPVPVQGDADREAGHVQLELPPSVPGVVPGVRQVIRTNRGALVPCPTSRPPHASAQSLFPS